MSGEITQRLPLSCFVGGFPPLLRRVLSGLLFFMGLPLVDIRKELLGTSSVNLGLLWGPLRTCRLFLLDSTML